MYMRRILAASNRICTRNRATLGWNLPCKSSGTAFNLPKDPRGSTFATEL